MHLLYVLLPLLVAASAPAWGSGLLEGFLTLALIYGASALLWGFLAEYAGMVSLGQQLFVGLGAYGLVIFGYLGMSTLPALLASAALSSVVAFALSFPLLRLRGAYFALGTWIVAEIFELAFNNWSYVGGGAGVTYGPALIMPGYFVFYGSLALLVVSSIMVYYIYRSKLGLGLRAIGSDEEVAAESGVSVFRSKIAVFVTSAAVTSVAGSLYALYAAYIIPKSIFNISWVIGFIFIAVIGGMGRIFGAPIGSLAFIGLLYATSAYAGWSLLLEGVIAIAVWFLMPRGIWGEIASRLKLGRPL
ncbi:MAG TPA: branched-chain amino acid ABC transporter permease [Nitrososphaeria archaeon]|jgi:branched-chain amino acid transport system permease protein|nr:branched-chain amino acid ABC transporter permease [Conexivisphaerales archaeon]PMP94929.1 MAG: branched-chain amino acid ABC transporter permease [Nitrososphaera sp.]HEU16481.1 branched-chain amino acid ABC transporter permease [Nitrososphaeria archaeon]